MVHVIEKGMVRFIEQGMERNGPFYNKKENEKELIDIIIKHNFN